MYLDNLVNKPLVDVQEVKKFQCLKEAPVPYYGTQVPSNSMSIPNTCN